MIHRAAATALVLLLLDLAAPALAVLAVPALAAPATPAAAEPQTGLPPAPPPSGIRRAGPASPPPPAAPAAATPLVRLATAEAFGEPVHLEVHGLPVATADAALRDAFDAIRRVAELTDPDLRAEGGGGLADLNAGAGGDPVALHPELLDLLARAHHFCVWSEGAHGPLGGNLYTLWGLRGPTPGIPPEPRLAAAAESARCDRLQIDAEAGIARLAVGARADLHGFARGFAVDRAVEVLRSHGASEALVAVGWVWRGLGGGPDGAGWRLVLPDLAGDAEGADGLVLDPVRLHGEAAAAVSAIHRPLRLGGERFAPWIDQRSGRPAEGVVATVAVAELAVDAEALAAAAMVLGNRQGSLRTGVLEPPPSMLWLLGSGDGVPMLAPVRWGRVTERGR